MAMVKVWNKEIKGKLYAVGDIHGCYNLLMSRLEEINFDFENDLLVAVGDLVDRGNQNVECIELLSKPWFTSVRGNHEDLCIWGLKDRAAMKCHMENGGEWFYELSVEDQFQIAKTFSELPIALEVTHRGKKHGCIVGFLHPVDHDPTLLIDLHPLLKANQN